MKLGGTTNTLVLYRASFLLDKSLSEIMEDIMKIKKILGLMLTMTLLASCINKASETGKSSLMIFDRHASLKYKYGNRHFWCRGYYVDTAGKNAKKIQEYICNQLKEDFTKDQINLKEYIDPFTGEKTNK